MMLPPIVPVLRVACEPTIAEASARPVKRSRISGVGDDRRVARERPEHERPVPPAGGLPASSRTRWIAQSESGSGALP